MFKCSVYKQERRIVNLKYINNQENLLHVVAEVQNGGMKYVNL